MHQGHTGSAAPISIAAPSCSRLASLGVTIHQGHHAKNLGAAQEVVHTTAVKEDNPELMAARASGRTILRRGEMQARLDGGHTQVAITGAHGKTTTTAMTAAVLMAGGLDPSVLVWRAVWDNLGGNPSWAGGIFCRRGRRKRRLLPLPRPPGGGDHQPRPGAPGFLPGPGPHPGNLRPVSGRAAAGGPHRRPGGTTPTCPPCSRACPSA